MPPYPEAPLSDIFGAEELIEKMPHEGIDKKEGLVIFGCNSYQGKDCFRGFLLTGVRSSGLEKID